MARRTVNRLMMHTMLKCQVRLAVAKGGVRVQVTSSPNSPEFSSVKLWPEEGEAERTITLEGGASAVTSFELSANENFWLEIAYGEGKKDNVQIRYERKKPFGYKAAKVINPARVELIGSVPRIRQ